MLGNINAKMAAAAFWLGSLLFPSTKCRQKMERTMRNSTVHETYYERHSSDDVMWVWDLMTFNMDPLYR